MSSIKVSALTAKTTPAGTEELLINDSGVSKKITIANLPDTDTTYSNFAGTTAGLVPTSTTGDDTKFLRADGTWVVPTDTDTNTTYTSSDFTHNDLSGVTANEHIDWTSDQGATNLHAGNYTDTNTTYTSSDFTHNSLSGVTANEHIDWTTDQGATNIHAGNYTDTNTTYDQAAINALGITATSVDLGNWTITESSGVAYFATGGVNKMKLDASGNLTVVGDVTAFGTI
jgi:hypothetical protein